VNRHLPAIELRDPSSVDVNPDYLKLPRKTRCRAETGVTESDDTQLQRASSPITVILDVGFAVSKSALREIAKITAEIHIYTEAHKLGLKKLVTSLRENGFEVVTMQSPFQTMLYGLIKPWNCSLKRYNNGNASLYRLLLSAIYGTGPIARTLKQSMETGSEGLLYAYRK
jgi:hypothetical protein